MSLARRYDEASVALLGHPLRTTDDAPMVSKVIVTRDVTDDELMNDMGEPALGVITGNPYPAAHDSPENKVFVAQIKNRRTGPSLRRSRT